MICLEKLSKAQMTYKKSFLFFTFTQEIFPCYNALYFSPYNINLSLYAFILLYISLILIINPIMLFSLID